MDGKGTSLSERYGQWSNSRMRMGEVIYAFHMGPIGKIKNSIFIKKRREIDVEVVL